MARLFYGGEAGGVGGEAGGVVICLAGIEGFFNVPALGNELQNYISHSYCPYEESCEKMVFR